MKSYKDILNETLILFCKVFDSKTPSLSALNNYNTFDGKTNHF